MSVTGNRIGYVNIAAGMMIFVCMGTIYSWSVFRKPLEKLLGIGATESILPYMIFLCSYALTMPLAGGVIERIGPRLSVILGGLLLSSGWFLSGFGDTITYFVFTFGVLGGCGVGLIYGVPLALAARWFPERKGLAVGITLAGFGLSPLITAPAATVLIESIGILKTFHVFGILFLVCISLLGLLLKYPDTNHELSLPAGGHDSGNNFEVREMLKSKEFYVLWSCFAIGTFSGLTAISVTSPLAQDMIRLKPEAAALSVSVFAVFNALGRPLFGSVTDKLGTRKTIVIAFLVIIAASTFLTFAGEGSTGLFFIAFSLFWLALGGWLAIAPIATSFLFGAKNYCRNYGFVFTAYGFGAVLGGLTSGVIKDITGSYLMAFVLIIVLAVAGIGIIATTAPVRKRCNYEARSVSELR